MEVQRIDRMNELIEIGRRAAIVGNHRDAVAAFTRASRACPCNLDGHRPRCVCKNFSAPVASPVHFPIKSGDIFYEAMYGPCSCAAARFAKCDKDGHVRALDLRAAAFEKLGALDRAKLDAEWVLELAPRRMESWLRLGKAARMRGDALAAWRIWTEGIEVGERWGSMGDPRLAKMRQLRQPLHNKFCRLDPLDRLPPEIVEEVLSFLNRLDCFRCLRLSKRWNAFLESSRTAWTRLYIVPAFKWTPAVLQSMSKLYQGRIRSLTMIVDDFEKLFGDRLAISAINIASKSLRQLAIHLNRGYPKFPGPKLASFSSTAFSTVSDLCIIGVPVELAEFLLKQASSTLRRLATDGPFELIAGPQLCSLPMLETLSLRVNSRRRQPIALRCLSDRTPNLKHFMLYGGDFQLALPLKNPTWPKVEKLAIIEHMPIPQLVDLKLLKYLEMDLRYCRPAVFTYIGTENLETFRLVSAPPDGDPTHRMTHDHLHECPLPAAAKLASEVRAIVEPCARAGLLKAATLGGIGAMAGPIELYSWLASYESLTTLEIDLPGTCPPDPPFDYTALAHFVNSFPSLETVVFGTCDGLALSSGAVKQQFCTMLERIITSENTTVKRLAISPTPLFAVGGHLEELAKKHGIFFYRSYRWHRLSGLRFGPDCDRTIDPGW